MVYSIECVQCGKIFTSNRKTTRYCSSKCRTEAKEKLLVKKFRKKCEVCGSVFYTNRDFQVLCGNPDCKRKHAKNIAKRKPNYLAIIREYFIFERDNFTCAYCGKSSFADGVQLQIDHIIPATKGGISVAGNLITACAECNSAKNNKEIVCKEEILAVVSKRNLARGIDNNVPLKIWADKSRRID